jgi:peptide deformylase
MLRKKEILTAGMCVSTIAIGIFSFQHFYKINNTVLKIIEPPDPTLRLASAPIESIDHSVISLSNNMVSTLRYRAMFDFFQKALLPRGLAAPQVGISKRLIVCGINGKIKVMINPQVIEKHGTFESKEGCVSVQKGQTRNVKRQPM